MISRRKFSVIAASALAIPTMARAQSGAPKVVGFLNSTSPRLYEFNAAAFRQGLRETGHVEGQNLRIEYRWSDGDYTKLPALAKELADLNVAAIAATGDVASAHAAQRATKTIPIVFTIGSDPIKFGLVASYNRPGGNITGISLISSNMGAKRIEVLHEIVPGKSIGMLMNPDNPNAETELRDAQGAAQLLGHKTMVFNVRNRADFAAAFERITAEKMETLFVGTDPMLLSQRDAIVAFAQQQRLPAIYFVREFALSGGLISYGASITFMYRQAGIYIGRILNGAKPGEMPVVQPTVIETVINMKTAKLLGLTIPPTLFARADEIIE